MATANPSNDESNKNFNSRLDAARIQLRSALPSDILRIMEQANRWLQEDPENKGVYALLVEVIQQNPDLRESVDSLIKKMIERGSKAAREAMSALPVSIPNLIAEADNAYYAAEYGKAIKLYQDVLLLDPDNQHASVQFAKAQANRLDRIEEKTKQLPRDAVQWFRQARSYIAANDLNSATTFLNAAIEEARARGVIFFDAEELLANIQNIAKEAQPSVPKIFISYSHIDEKHMKRLDSMLKPYKKQNIFEIWHDREITEGAEWYQDIQNAVNTCDIALLLVSIDFLNSRFIQEEELPRLIQLRKEKGLHIIPIIIRDCPWKSVPILKDLQALPQDGRPIISYSGTNQPDRIWAEIAMRIAEFSKKL